ncbi:MAG: hypothetical protein IJ711_00230 [Lachnospiraceae bacterium]|nr:hypothetical protein [Clostridia bacterium]MBR1691182.1 hypothetical protein [Lachnospiraceae bacterium]
MALTLIDLDAEANYIDIDASKVPYQFSVKLVDKTYTFAVKYNDEGKFFTIDLYDSEGEPLAFGEPVRYGRALFNVVEDERFPIPVIIPTCITDDGISEVTAENFGKEVKLYVYDRQVS